MSARNWGLVVAGVVVLCLAISFSLAFQLDFVLIGLVVVAALVVTYIAGRIDKRKQRGPWANENSDG